MRRDLETFRSFPGGGGVFAVRICTQVAERFSISPEMSFMTPSTPSRQLQIWRPTNALNTDVRFRPLSSYFISLFEFLNCLFVCERQRQAIGDRRVISQSSFNFNARYF
ncbi:hypothetical protein TcasGA2_TC012478 [Tribolium castaneum]|uniref:Uncharacterized protein n=1 Tax=Tribolium castaneum TaxID=7070 RepID=D6X2N4_TRICA|nr:hypothetical protein TcasGA2_TC012478 [Tribolium castaneum]